MKISMIPDSGGHLSLDELIPQLSEVVLSVSNEEIRSRKESLEEKRSSLAQKKKEMGKVKDEIIKLGAERKRLKALKRCLDLINTLRREGVLRGGNQSGMSQLLREIENKDIQSLNKIEERLTIYLPEKTNRVSIM